MMSQILLLLSADRQYFFPNKNDNKRLGVKEMHYFEPNLDSTYLIWLALYELCYVYWIMRCIVLTSLRFEGNFIIPVV